MSHTLIISDNEILNQLYITNLEVYLATKTTLTLSSEEAINSLNKNKFDLVICMSMVNGQDLIGEVYDHMKSMGKLIPLIAIGQPNRELSDVVIVNSSYHLQNLIKSSAKILGVTAKQMASLEMPQYYSVEAKFLMKIQVIPCPVFFQTRNRDSDEYIMIAKKGDKAVSLKKFTDEGVSKLFVNSGDRLTIVNGVSLAICELIKNTEGHNVNVKSEALNNAFEFVAATFGQTPVAVAEIMRVANSCTKLMEEVVKDTPSLKGLLAMLNSNKGGHVYTHTMLAAYVSSHIIKNVTWGGETHIEKINFVLFFHDIMLASIYLKHPDLKFEEDLLFSDKLNDKEKEVVLNHARLAAEIMVTHKRSPIGADLLIKQHHGMTNGVGFAMEYKDDISPLSKIVLVAESFVEEFLKEKDENTLYQLDVKKIQATLLEKFKKSTYKKIVETLNTMTV